MGAAVAPDVAWPPIVADFPLPAGRTALVLVDLQVFTCDPGAGWGPVLGRSYRALADYYYGRLGEVVLPNARRLLDGFRALGAPVVHVTVGPHFADGADMLRLRAAAASSKAPPIGAVGTPGHAIFPALAPRAGEAVLNKVTRSAFTSTGLDSVLRNHGVEAVLVAGTLTNSCVESTARDAADRGYGAVVVGDACATFDPHSHEAALRGFARIFGRVLATAEALDRLRAPARARGHHRRRTLK